MFFLLYNFKTYSQSLNQENSFIAILNCDIENLLVPVDNGFKKVDFYIKGINNKNQVDELINMFYSFGGVVDCSFIQSDTDKDIYNVKIKFYQKVNLNFFIKMLVTFNINSVIYKDVLQPTESLKRFINSEIN